MRLHRRNRISHRRKTRRLNLSHCHVKIRRRNLLRLSRISRLRRKTRSVGVGRRVRPVSRRLQLRGWHRPICIPCSRSKPGVWNVNEYGLGILFRGRLCSEGLVVLLGYMLTKKTFYEWSLSQLEETKLYFLQGNYIIRLGRITWEQRLPWFLFSVSVLSIVI